jgi:hypothetical protein
MTEMIVRDVTSYRRGILSLSPMVELEQSRQTNYLASLDVHRRKDDLTGEYDS